MRTNSTSSGTSARCVAIGCEAACIAAESYTRRPAEYGACGCSECMTVLFGRTESNASRIASIVAC